MAGPGTGGPYSDPRVGAQSATWGAQGQYGPVGPNSIYGPPVPALAPLMPIPPNNPFGTTAASYTPPIPYLTSKLGYDPMTRDVATQQSALTSAGGQPGIAMPGGGTAQMPPALTPYAQASNALAAKEAAAQPAAQATPWGAYGLAGGLAAAGTTLGYLGARKAAGAAEAQRAQVNQQAAAARSQVTKDVERFRDVSQSQAARAGAAHGLLDSGLTARSQATKAQYAEEILASKLSDIQQRRMQMIAEIPTDDEIWAGFYGQLAGTTIGLAGLAAGSAIGNPMAGAMVGNVLGQYAQQGVTGAMS